MTTLTYTIAWGHSGTRGQDWDTAREAARYAAETWGAVHATSAAAAVACVEAEMGATVEDWHLDGSVIHIVLAD